MTKQSQNIAVLGAGVMGLMSAYALAKDGHNITIYDPQGFPAHNASWMAGGMLAPYSEIEHMDEAWVQAGLAGIEIWRDIPLQTGFTHKGSLLIAHEEDRYILERFRSHLPAPLQSRTNPQDIEPSLPSKFRAALHLPQEAHLSPHTTLFELCKAIREKSVTFIEAPWDKNMAKNFDHIIDCRGMGAEDPELRGVKGETLIVRNEAFSLSRPVRLMHPRYPLYIIPREDHMFMIGATNIEGDDNSVTIRSAMELMSALYSLHPSFGEAEIIDIQAGVRPSYPDNLPRIKTSQNVISCNGLYRHGFLLAPVMAACVRDFIAGEESRYWQLFTHKCHSKHSEGSEIASDPSLQAPQNDAPEKKRRPHEHHHQRAA